MSQQWSPDTTPCSRFWKLLQGVSRSAERYNQLQVSKFGSSWMDTPEIRLQGGVQEASYFLLLQPAPLDTERLRSHPISEAEPNHHT